MKINKSKQIVLLSIILCIMLILYAGQCRNAEIAETSRAEINIESVTPASMNPIDVNKIILVDDESTVTTEEEKTEVVILTEPVTEEVLTQNYSDYSDLEYLSAIIYAEAGNQCYAGQVAVGIVVMNRVRSGSFPNTVKEVLYQSGQFTPASSGSLNRALNMYRNGELPGSCIDAATAALNGVTIVEYNEQVYEMNDYLFFGRYRENCRLQIQDHQFS